MSESTLTADSEALQEWSGCLFAGDLVRLRELRDSDLPELCAWWNTPEPAVLQQERITALGFAIEGRRRAAVYHRGEFHDQILFGLLAKDYSRQRAAKDTKESTGS